MSNTTKDHKASVSVHLSFWVIGTVALLWNLGGVVNFIMQMMNADIVNSFRTSERAIIDGRPMWATGAFALAVFGGLLGCLLLLIRKSASTYVFILSLIGVIGTMFHALGAGIDFGAGEIVGIILMPLVLAAFLIWYSKYAERKGWFGSDND